MAEKKPQRTRATRRRLLVADDHALIRRGLVSMLNNEPDLEVCAEAATRQAALEAISSARPDMVTVDISLGESDGLGLIKDIHAQFPDLPVLVISMHDEVVYAERALRAGARGYVTKQEMDETVLAAIRCVLGGGQYLSSTMGAFFARQYLSERPGENETPLAALSDRETRSVSIDRPGKNYARDRPAPKLEHQDDRILPRAPQVKALASFRCGAVAVRHPLDRDRQNRLTSTALRARGCLFAKPSAFDVFSAVQRIPHTPHRGFPMGKIGPPPRCGPRGSGGNVDSYPGDSASPFSARRNFQTIHQPWPPKTAPPLQSRNGVSFSWTDLRFCAVASLS